MLPDPLIKIPLGDPTLLPHVLSSNVFASRGYIWGNDGTSYYCVVNPNKLDYQIFRKEKRFTWYLKPWWAELLYRYHFTWTAKSKKAPVVTNGPQMRLNGDMQFEEFLTLLLWTMGGGALLFGIIGYIAGKLLGFPISGVLAGAAVGALLGFFGTLSIVAAAAEPFNSVITPNFVHIPRHRHTFSYHFGRAGNKDIRAYRCGRGEPSGLTWGCGGLTGVIENGSSLWSDRSERGELYRRAVRRNISLVVLALRPIDISNEPKLLEAINTQLGSGGYNGTEPMEGVIIVVGSPAYTDKITKDIVAQKVRDAAATDGNHMALLGAIEELIISPTIFGDPFIHYGFEMH